jgi:hypothetical protein
MISRYKDRQGKVYTIAEMDDEHLLNAHRYFSMKRLEMRSRKSITGKDLLNISLLINALWQEIDKRELLKY